MFRHESLDIVVNQAIWMEGDAHFADVILPACTKFERWDISELANSGGYIHHNTHQLNHRMVMMQHKCIEPLGESKSDYDIFTGILNRMGTGAIFTEGCSDLDWAKRLFMASDVSKRMKWADFVKKGYYVVPPEPEAIRTPRNYGWFAEGRPKDAPEPIPLPSQWSGDFLKGLSTQSGKLEFIPNSLKRFDSTDPERNPLNRYWPSWEGPRTEALVKRFPVQMISTHSRYSFHTYGDGKDFTINDIPDHRVNVGGYYYWVIRINDEDAKARGIKHHDLTRVYNDRGSVVCAADVSSLVMRGVCKTYELSAEFRLPVRSALRARRLRRLRQHPHARPAANPQLRRHGLERLPGPVRDLDAAGASPTARLRSARDDPMESHRRCRPVLELQQLRSRDKG